MCLMEEKRVAYCPCKKHYGFHGDAPYQDGMGRCAFDRSMTGLNPGAPGFPDNTVYQRLRFINNGLVICMEPQGHAILAPNHTYASQLFQPSPPPSPPGAANLPQRRLAVPRRAIRALRRAGGGPQPTRHQLQSARAHHQRVGGPLSRRVLREPRVPSRVRAAGVPPEPHHGHPNSRAGGLGATCKWQGQCTSGDGYIGSYGGGEFNGWLTYSATAPVYPKTSALKSSTGASRLRRCAAARAAPPAALASPPPPSVPPEKPPPLAAAGQSSLPPRTAAAAAGPPPPSPPHPAPAAAPRSSTRGRSALRNSRSRACAQTQAAIVPAGNGFTSRPTTVPTRRKMSAFYQIVSETDEFVGQFVMRLGWWKMHNGNPRCRPRTPTDGCVADPPLFDNPPASQPADGPRQLLRQQRLLLLGRATTTAASRCTLMASTASTRALRRPRRPRRLPRRPV